MRRRATGVWLALILIVTLAIYAPSLANGFTLDAGRIAAPTTQEGRPNLMVGTLRPLGEYWSRNYWYGDDAGSSTLYRPLAVLSFALTNAALGGVDADPGRLATVHHGVNIVLHLLATLLAWALLHRFARSAGAALLATGVFALHALRSEAVIDLTSRNETMAFVFGAGFVLLGRATEARTGGRRLGAAALASSSLFLALSSKESALAWVPLALVFVVAGARRDGRAVAVAVRREGLPLLLIAAIPVAAWALLRAPAIASAGGVADVDYLVNPLYYHEAPTRVLTAVRIWLHGLWLTVVPLTLASNYGHATFALIESPLEPGFLGSAAVLLVVSVGGLFASRRRPELLLAVAFFFGAGFATSNIPFGIGTAMAERLYYTPALALSWLLLAAVGRGGGAAIAAVGVWCAACCATIVQRDFAWRDNDTLCTTDARVHPRCAQFLRHVAGLRGRAGDLSEAAAILDRVIEIDPLYADALADRGTIHGSAGRLAMAEDFYRRALATPEWRRGARTHIVTNLISVLRSQGEHAEAEHWSVYQRGLLAMQGGDPAAAVPALRAACAWFADASRLRIELAAALAHSGDVPAARAEYRALLDDGGFDRFTRQRIDGRLRALDDR